MRDLNTTAAAVLFAGLLSILSAQHAVSQATDTRPRSVILVTIDTLRSDAVSFMGQRRKTTPFLDQLADKGIIFTRALATSPWTAPSMASIFTCLYPTSHGVVEGLVERVFKSGDVDCQLYKQPLLSSSFTVLAEVFRSGGYKTVGIPANLHLQAGTGFDQGFDHYYGQAKFLTGDRLNKQVRALMTKTFGEDWRTTWKEQPTFLWLHYFDPHDAYFAREPWIETYAPEYSTDKEVFPSGMRMKQLKDNFEPPFDEIAPNLEALYHSEVNFVDRQIRSIFEDLGVDESVLVIITSDHGEEFADHNGLGHGHTLYEELVRVPLVIYWPAALPRGVRVDDVVSILDVYPTLSELAGLEVPSGLQGRSLLPLLDEDRPTHRRVEHMELHPPHEALRAVCDGRWKLILPGNPDSDLQLFDLAADPGEKHNDAARNPDVVKRLKSLDDEWYGNLSRPPKTEYYTSTEKELLKKLKSLGYVR